jgi:glycosyltransferase involved in cell wall biosynthesis
MKIAYIVSALSNKGPVIVVKELVSQFTRNGHHCIVYYFDNKIGVNFDCPVHKIEKGENIDFTLYDVVHSHGLRPDKYIYDKREKDNKKTLFVTTLHNYVLQDLRYQYNWFVSFVFGNLWMYWLRKHDKIVTLSKHANQYYGDRFPLNKLTYAYNTRKPDTTKKLNAEELKELIDFKGDSILLGVNALLSPRKGIDLLINALVELPEYKLFIVGDGQSRRKLESLAIEKGVADRCYFARYKADAYRYLEHYNIFVLPSRSEGFPLSLLEASVYAIPTVSSDIPIIKEAFTNEEISFFELSNPLTIVNAIKIATTDKELGKKFYNKYFNSYSPKIMYERYFEIYNRKI